MFPEASQYFAPLVYALSIIAIVYTSMVALAQIDGSVLAKVNADA
jgi:NADH-quinone oxidoreductase subunit M